MVHSSSAPDPGAIPGWNLALRFALELAALVGIGAGAWSMTAGALRWLAVAVAPLLATTVWGVFNVVGDPSRSGNAPVPVPGPLRLLVEFVVFVAGWWGAMRAGWSGFALVYAVALVFHHLAALSRVRWLVGAS